MSKSVICLLVRVLFRFFIFGLVEKPCYVSVAVTKRKSVIRSAWQAWESVPVLPCLTKDRLAIHLLHRQACLNAQNTYTDPATKLKVLTRYAHLQRGKCCGSQCRHCPYGHMNVAIDLSQPRKIFNTSYYE